MNLRNREHRSSALIASVGWLFADLLLALSMLFLVANTQGVPVVATPTPTPTRAVLISSPTPKPLPRLDTRPLTLTLNVDSTQLLQGASSAINSVKQQIQVSKALRGRRAGLVIAYGGAPSANDISTAQSIASKVMNVLASLGKEGFVFIATSYHDPLFVYGGNPNTVQVEI